MVELLILRLVHIVAGALWVGSGVYATLFLMPALTESGVDAGKLFGALERRGLFTFMPVIAVLTILTGLRLMWIVSDGFGPAYFSSTAGQAYTVSGVAAVLTFLLAMFVSRPASVRAAQLGAALPRTPEPERAAVAGQAAALRRRASSASWAAVALLVLATAGMAIARYL